MTNITPDCIRLLYFMEDFVADSNVKSRIGVSGFLDQLPQFGDVSAFMNDFSGKHHEYALEIISIDGGRTEQKKDGTEQENPTMEANLDVSSFRHQSTPTRCRTLRLLYAQVQYPAALSRNIPIVFYSTAGVAPHVSDLDFPNPIISQNEPYITQLRYLLNLADKDLPDVLTTSYSESEQTVPRAYAIEVCNLFAELGARGVSVIFSSGDTGVGSACESNDDERTARFAPEFPPTCPFVTSVGGTEGAHPDRAALFSSGGFSNYFERPSWQEESWNTWKKESKGDTELAKYFNAGGRGVPDVAVLSTNFQVVNKGELHTVGGTR